MNENITYNISYVNMKKIVKNYFIALGRDVSLKINNEIDSDRFAGTVVSSYQLVEKRTIAGVESKTSIDFSIDDLKSIISSVLEQSGQELISLKDNAATCFKIEGYGMGEHEVETITNKSFTITSKEVKLSRKK
ncbi:MAG: hypothetical protein J5634_03380 [Bacilli bacterium]|nr:hypothetical protein [Bacilli bacterium]